MAPHRAFKIYELEDHLLVVPSDGSIKTCLRIDRVDASVSEVARPLSTSLRGQFVLGVALFGVIQLHAGSHLVVVTASRRVGRIAFDQHSHDILRVDATRLVSISNVMAVDAQHRADDARYLSMLQSLLNMPFYFSYDFDLTHSLQRAATINHELPLHARADNRFFWNRYLSRSLIEKNLDDWVIPIMMGHIDIHNNLKLSGKNVDFILISRRSINRAGTRYVVRGLDESGNAANFVETEQVVVVEGTAASFVQTRGSIPLFWHQKVNLKYKPRPTLHRAPEEVLPITRKHFEDQVALYGDQVAVNLIDQKGSEKDLGTAYENQVKALNNPHVHYFAFDFHTECKNMKYENLAKLIKNIDQHLHNHGYLLLSKDGKAQKQQNGVVRTNCMDNLDRSNVVQSVIARHILREIFSEIGIAENAQFESIFKNVWANNADAISNQYTGTGALKTDYTRTGKRSYSGILNDGLNSISRYYLNNFVDGFRQDSFDLFLGNYQVAASNKSPFVSEKPLTLPMICLILSLVIVLSLLASHFEYSPIPALALLLVWLAVLFVFFKAIMAAAHDWVDKPRLLSNH